MDDWKFAFQVLHTLLTGGIGFYVYMTNKDKVTNKRISDLEQDLDGKLDRHAERIAKVETRADSAPTHGDLEKIHEKINSVNSCAHRMEGQLDGVKNLVQVMHESLMRDYKK
jgi:hypothetical protein